MPKIRWLDLNWYVYCGYGWKWRLIIAVNFQFKQSERRSLRKIRASTGFEPVTSAKYRCDALPTELWSHTLGARSIYWVHIFPCSDMAWSICTAVVDESEDWSFSKLIFTFIHNRSTHRNFFIYTSRHFTARKDMNSINWPRSQCVAS